MTIDLYANHSYPVMIVISGPSAVGKDTIARRLQERRPDDFYFVVTATSREPRVGEIHGVDYFFVTDEQFEQMIADGEFLEYALVYGQYKGIPKKHIRAALASDKDVIMRVDVQGAETVRGLLPNALQVFLRTTDEADLIARLRARKADTPENMERRIAEARREMERMPEFDYCVVNARGRQEEAVDKILSIIDAARCRVNQEPIEI